MIKSMDFEEVINKLEAVDGMLNVLWETMGDRKDTVSNSLYGIIQLQESALDELAKLRDKTE